MEQRRPDRDGWSPISSTLPTPEIAPYYDPFDPPLDPIEMQRYVSSYENSPQPTPPPPAHSARSPEGEEEQPPRPGPYPLPHPSGRGQYEQVALDRALTVSYDDKPRKSTETLSKFSTISRFKTDADTQNLVSRRTHEVQPWKIHWEAPVIMVSLFVLGVMGAVAHHLFYSHLDGQPATHQLMMVRYGTALAFFTKATLVGSVIMSYRQRIWFTLRRKAMRVDTIDGMFAATENPWEFRKWEMIKGAKLATLMALATWLIPIAAVLAPASLTTQDTPTTNSTRCTVANLNFTNEAYYNFRDEINYAGGSLAYYNTTSVNETAGFFDYFDQPSKNARRLTITSAYIKKPVYNDASAYFTCGPGWNCTYIINFIGPGYNCEQLASGPGSNISVLESMGAPINTSTLAPEGDNIYITEVDIGEYMNPQLPTNSHGEPIQDEPPWPENLGAFLTEPVLWIGHSVPSNDTYPPDSPYASRYATVHTPEIFKCTHYTTNYTVFMNYTESVQISTVLQRDFLAPIINTTATLPTLTNMSDVVITPTTGYLQPSPDTILYKQTAAYHSLGLLLRTFLRGSIEYSPGSSYPLTRSDISETRLIDASTAYPVENLQAQLQSVYEDMLLTLLSEPHLTIAANRTVPCTKTRMVNVYKYQPRALWPAYALVVFVTLVHLVIGMTSLFQNGVAHETLFSRIMVTTRNPTLDQLSTGACLGSDPFPMEIKKVKLRFGVLRESEEEEESHGGIRHCAFGTEGETDKIVRGGMYAGLNRYVQRRTEIGDSWEKAPLVEEKENEDDRFYDCED